MFFWILLKKKRIENLLHSTAATITNIHNVDKGITGTRNEPITTTTIIVYNLEGVLIPAPITVTTIVDIDSGVSHTSHAESIGIGYNIMYNYC